MDRRGSLVVVVAGLVGCSPDLPADLGEWAEDRVVIAGDPVLGHLAAALPDRGEGLTVEQFLRTQQDYGEGPDPGALFVARRAEHVALPPQGPAEPLRLLTYNTALLGRWFAFISTVMPELATRRRVLSDIVLADGWDIVLLQEIWDLQDVDRLRAAAKEHGYLVYAGSEAHHEEHGLAIAVRAALVDQDQPQERSEHQYEQQRELEDFPGPGVLRGFLRWSFVHAPTGVRLHLFDTHATSFPGFARTRDFQVRQLGGAVRAIPEDEVAFIGGDFNGGAYYPDDAFGVTDGDTVTGWWSNTAAYALLLYYAGAEDLHNAAGVPTDVADMDAVPAWSSAHFDAPFGDGVFCEREPRPFLTAIDCNSLYFRSYAGTEYPARIDHLFMRDVQRRVRVQATEMAYTERRMFGEEGPFELSDHYGVAATLTLERLR